MVNKTYFLDEFKGLVTRKRIEGLSDAAIACMFNFDSAVMLHDAIMKAKKAEEVFLNTPRARAVTTLLYNGERIRFLRGIEEHLISSNDKPTKIIQNGPAYIVFWSDGTKTVMKRKEDDQDDPYAAFGQALAKKIFGSTTHVHKMVDACYQDHTPCGYESASRSIYDIADAIRCYMDQIKKAWIFADQD